MFFLFGSCLGSESGTATEGEKDAAARELRRREVQVDARTPESGSDTEVTTRKQDLQQMNLNKSCQSFSPEPSISRPKSPTTTPQPPSYINKPKTIRIIESEINTPQKVTLTTISSPKQIPKKTSLQLMIKEPRQEKSLSDEDAPVTKLSPEEVIIKLKSASPEIKNKILETKLKKKADKKECIIQ